MLVHEQAYAALYPHIRDHVRGYIEHGYIPGSFLTAVLSNDLCGSYSCADEINSFMLRDLVCWLYNHAPSNCWGSPRAVAGWLQSHRETAEPTPLEQAINAVRDMDPGAANEA